MGRFIKPFVDFNVNSKLFTLNCILVVCLILMAISTNFLFKSSRVITIIINEERIFSEHFQDGIEEFYKYKITGDDETLKKALEHFDNSNKIAFTFARIDSFMNVMPKKEWIPYFYSVFKEGYNNDIKLASLMGEQIKVLDFLNRKRLKGTQEIAYQASILGNQMKSMTISYSQDKSEEKFSALQSEFIKVHTLTREFGSNINSLNEYISGMLTIVLILLVILLGAITYFFTSRIGKSISYPILQLTENFKQIAKGNLKSSVQIESKNEIGELSNAFSKIQIGLQEIVDYSKKVAKGDYSSKLTPKSDGDELSLALNKMVANLEDARQKTIRENWMQKGLGGLDVKMRGNYSVRELSNNIISYLSEFLETQIGAIYVYDDILGHLEFAGSIGLNPSEIKNTVLPGEGLVGKTAKQELLQILDTKEKYHKVYSATGEMYPSKLYLLPLFYNNQIQAVIELAAINELNEDKIEFLKQAGESISVNLNAAVARFRHKELLDKTLEQAAILQSREEELNKKLAEIQEIQEKLTRQKALLDAMLNTLPDYIYFKDTDSKFLRISQSMVKLFSVAKSDDIIGKSDFDFHTPENAKIYFEEEKEIMKKGEGFIDVIRQGVDEKGNELWTSVSKLPMYNDNGECIGTFGISKDVTNIKKLEIEVKKTSEFLQNVLDTLPDPVFVKECKEHRFVIVNDALCKYNNQRKEDLLGKNDFDLFPINEANEFIKREKELIQSKKDLNIEEQATRDGKLTYTYSQKRVIKTPDGNEYIVGLNHDITELKKMQIEINNQNDQLLSKQEKLEQNIHQMDQIQSELIREKSLIDALLENIPDAIYFKDLDSKFLKVSKSMMKKFITAGKDNILGLTDFDIQDSVHAKEAFEDEQEIIRTGKPKIGYVEKELTKDGTYRYILTTKMPYFDGHGKVLGTFGISRDITKLKELEIEINEQYKILQEQQEELKTANEELKSQEEELRVANEELAEQTKILTESEKSLQQQQEELRVANEELELKTNELEIQRNNISEKNQSLLKIQSELKQKAKELEMASTYKSEFLANMSHELRTPLNSLLILSKLLGNNKHGNLSEDQVKSINIINKSGRDLLDLINEILDLSKIEAGKMTYEFSDTAVHDIKTEILQGFKPVAENKNLTLEINIDEGFPKTIFTDRQRLMQIIKNLLSNAFKFTSAGGIKVNMGIPTKNIRFVNSTLNSKNTYFIAVEDSGVGIPRNKVDAIFEAFQQADGSISRKFGGTGLGLSISKQLTRVMGGEIHVDSTESIGSVFTLYLPTDHELVGKELKESGKIQNSKPSTITLEGTKSEAQDSDMTKEWDDEKIEMPFFIDDDRNSDLQQLVVLIIHPDKEKAKQLLDLCHKRKSLAIISRNIADGISLAENFLPKAIILSADLKDPKEFEQLKRNQVTSRLPVHFVTKIEDNTLENLEELKTPESEEFQTITRNLGGKLNKEYNQVLVVEDDPATLEAIHLLFEDKDIIIHEAKNGQQAYDMITAKSFDCIILDLGLPDFSGKELLEKLNAENITVPNVIIHTARELSQKELRELRKYSDSIVIKGVKSDERLMDEVSMFLHQVATSLPRYARPPLADESENAGFKGKRILVVDDDIRNIFALAQILEEKEIEVLEAENGEIALNILKENKGIDLILMDIMMPVMDGYETMKRIREIPEIQNIPIITLTAKAMKEDFQKAIDSGANDYISKPVDIDKLISLLKIWLFK